MGKPVLGENCKLEVIIEESYDFKNTVDKLIKKTNLATVIGTHSWREQFLEAITVSAGGTLSPVSPPWGQGVMGMLGHGEVVLGSGNLVAVGPGATTLGTSPWGHHPLDVTVGPPPWGHHPGVTTLWT
ncbi:hypothetical protein AV530_018224 [Patagioenas fasciata monilis]|uniref:Uncharacterized protein n=1 Tax=Patagioenas fasciata monilis TaxID=372326 RepID=A0A1V4J7P4_PATFA|nr:hypothetical protein AV530_018224 [Patagioenas fasciata monilis]